MSQVAVSQIYDRTGSKILLPRSGSVIQTITQRVDATSTHANTEITPLNITITPSSVGNTILVEWIISGEASSANNGAFILVNGSFGLTGGFPAVGGSEAADQQYQSGNYGYFIWNSDGNNATTPSTASILFPFRAVSVEPLTFSIYGNGTFYLNRTVNTGTVGTVSNEITVSFVNAYEFKGI